MNPDFAFEKWPVLITWLEKMDYSRNAG